MKTNKKSSTIAKKSTRNGKFQTKIKYPRQKVVVLEQNSDAKTVQNSSFGVNLNPKIDLVEENEKLNQQIDELENQKDLGLLGGTIDTSTLQEKLTAGNNITISNNTISATDTTYTAGANVSISDQNVISATNTTYTAGDNISISNGVISSTNTTYSAGTGINIENGVISATASGGMTQEQSNQLSTVYDYYLSLQTEPDVYYTPQTPSDYPAGTIIQTYDYYERELNVNSTYLLTLPTVHFCAEAGCQGQINITLNVMTESDINIYAKIYVNDVLLDTKNFDLYNNQNTILSFSLLGVILNQNYKGNRIYIQLGMNGSSTIHCHYQKIEVIAPNANILNNIDKFAVECFDGTYYLTDCTSGSAKVAIHSAENLYNINNFEFIDTGYPAQSCVVGRNTKQYNGEYIYDDTIYACTTKENKVVTYSENNQNTFTGDFYYNFDYYYGKNTSTRFLVGYYPTTARYITINPTNTSRGIGSLSFIYTNIVKSTACKNLGSANDNFPTKLYIAITQNGEIYLAENTGSGNNSINLGYGTKAKVYLTSFTYNSSYTACVILKRFDKIIKYDISRSSSGLSIVSSTQLGSYDDFWLGCDNDYFALKNGTLSYHKF